MGWLHLVHQHSLSESHIGIRSKIIYIKKLKFPHSEIHTFERIKYLLLILIEIQIEACTNRHCCRNVLLGLIEIRIEACTNRHVCRNMLMGLVSLSILFLIEPLPVSFRYAGVTFGVINFEVFWHRSLVKVLLSFWLGGYERNFNCHFFCNSYWFIGCNILRWRMWLRVI